MLLWVHHLMRLFVLIVLLSVSILIEITILIAIAYSLKTTQRQNLKKSGTRYYICPGLFHSMV
jgi:hypothetical protein